MTTTDFYGYDRDLIIGDPPLIHDHSHRHVLAFRHGDGDDHFSKAFNRALAFSARATSCFPGAFPPVSLELFGSYLKDDGADLSNLEPFFRLYKLSNAEPGADVLRRRRCPRQSPVRPCDPRAQAEAGRVRGRPASPLPRAPPRGAGPQAARQIAEPAPHDPRHDLGHPEEGADPRRDPRGLAPQRARPAHPRHHRDDVRSDRPAGREDRGRRLSAGSPRQHVGRRRSATGATSSTRRRRPLPGSRYATYLRSKVSGVVDRYARTICRLSDYPEDCNQAAFVRAVLRSWAEERLFPKRGERAGRGRGPGRVPAEVRPRLRRSPAALRDRRPQLVVPGCRASPASRRAAS